MGLLPWWTNHLWDTEHGRSQHLDDYFNIWPLWLHVRWMHKWRNSTTQPLNTHTTDDHNVNCVMARNEFFNDTLIHTHILYIYICASTFSTDKFLKSKWKKHCIEDFSWRFIIENPRGWVPRALSARSELLRPPVCRSLRWRLKVSTWSPWLAEVGSWNSRNEKSLCRFLWFLGSNFLCLQKLRCPTSLVPLWMMMRNLWCESDNVTPDTSLPLSFNFSC